MTKPNERRRRMACEYIDHSGVAGTIQTYFEEDFNLCLIGPPGIGKTTLVEQLAGNHDNLISVIGTKMVVSDLVGSMGLDGDTTFWKDGLLIQAMRHGKTFYLDEISGVPQKCALILHGLMDHRRQVSITGSGETVTAHPNFRFICSDNYSSSGVSSHTRELRDRMVCVYMDRLDRETEAKLLIDRFALDTDDVEWLLTFADVTRRAEGEGGASTRQLGLAAQAIVAGIDRKQAALNCILAPIAGNSRQQYERLLNAVRAEGLDLDGVWQTPTVNQFEDLEYVDSES